ncbi:11499_t:CDS:1, partial [Dentiscutata erythropus]
MLKNLALLIFIFIIAIFGNLTFAVTPTIPFEWKRNELFGAFQDNAYQVGTFSNQSSLVARDVYTCLPGFSQCPGTDLCCSLQCSIICDNVGCCPSNFSCCGEYCCKTNYTCCGIYCCDPEISYCCPDKSGCCMLGYECVGNGLCRMPTMPTTVTQITQEVVEYVVRYISEYVIVSMTSITANKTETKIVTATPTETTTVKTAQTETTTVIDKGVIKWATDNGYSVEEADQLEETAEKLVECIYNPGISFENSSVANNASCISCENIKTLTNIYINSPPTNDEKIAILKFLYSLTEDIKDASECKFNLACMNGTDSCSQDSLIT